MSRSKGFWKAAETNQSPGSGPLHAAVDICDSLACEQDSVRAAARVLSSMPSSASRRSHERDRRAALPPSSGSVLDATAR
jgi:hypothetical protein